MLPAMLFLTQDVADRRRQLVEQIRRGTLTAEEAFRRGLELDPFDHMALLGVAHECDQQGKLEEARHFYWRALEAEPGDSQSYGLLARSYYHAGDDPELSESLMYLAWRKMLRDPERAERVLNQSIENFKDQFQKALPDTDPELLVELVSERGLDRPDEPERVARLLRPYRLIQDLFSPPEDGLSHEQVDRIVAHGAECVALLVGVLRGFARNPNDRTYFEAEAALGLLGEIGDPAALPAVVEFTNIDDEGLAECANWAAWRIAARHRELAAQVRKVPRPGVELTVYDICCVPPEEEEELTPPRPVRPGRNDACWCGSGKKYKKCHLVSDEESDRAAGPESDGTYAAEPETLDARISGMLLEFLKESVGKGEMEQALDKFFGSRPSEMGQMEQVNFFDWLCNDYSPRRFGRPLAQEYLARNRSRLSARDRQALEDWTKSRYSLFEVQRVEPGTGVELKDLLLGETLFVHDVSSSEGLCQWDWLLSRIRPEEGRQVFTAAGLIVPPAARFELRDWTDSDRKASGLEWLPYLRENSHRIRGRFLEMGEQWRKNVQMVTAEGDPLVFASATYQILDQPALLQAFEGSALLGEREDDAETISFPWLEAGEEDQPRRVLGHLRIREGLLVLECSSRQRLKRGTKLIQELAAGAVKELRRAFESVDQMKRKMAASPAKKAESVPPEVEKELVEKYLEQHYRTWPDTPLPALGGLTPRQAAQQPAQRERLIALLKMMENGEQHRRREGHPWFDFSRIKEELGVEY